MRAGRRYNSLRFQISVLVASTPRAIRQRGLRQPNTKKWSKLTSKTGQGHRQGSIRMAIHRRRRGPPQTQVAIVGKSEIYNRENCVVPFLVHNFLGPRPPPPPLLLP